MNFTMFQRSVLVFAVCVIVLSGYLVLAQAQAQTAPLIIRNRRDVDSREILRDPLRQDSQPLDGDPTLRVDRPIRDTDVENKNIEEAYVKESYAPLTGEVPRARRYEQNSERKQRLRRLDSDLVLKNHDNGMGLQHDEAPGVQESAVATTGDRAKRDYYYWYQTPIIQPFGACVGLLLCLGR